MSKVRALVRAWLVVDFFGDARRSGGASSTLTTTIFTQSFLALVFAAMLFPETPPVPFAAANLCLSSLLVATGALGENDQRNRRAADRTLLGSAPLRRTTVALARGGHAAFFVCLVTIGMALPPAILLGFLCSDPLPAVGYVLAACACSGLAAGALGVAMRWLDRWCGQLRAALIGGTLKAVLLGGGLVLFALGLQRLQGTADQLPIGRWGAELLPPYHASRLLAEPAHEAWRLLPFAAAAALLLVLAAAAGEAESDGRVRSGRSRFLHALLQRLTGTGPRLAIADFVAVSIWRSPSFRSRVLPMLGLPAGAVFLTLPDGGQQHGFVFTCLLLQMPAIYLPFVIAFLPRADQTDAGWVFDHAPPLAPGLVRDATWRALVVHVLLPVHTLALAAMLAFGRAGTDAIAASVFSFAVAIVAARPMLRALDCVPFTRNHDAAAGIDLGGLFAAALLLGGLGVLFGAWASPAGRWVASAIAGTGAALLLARRPLATLPDGIAEGCGPEAVAEPQVGAEERDEAATRRPVEASLRRELRAIGVLYAAGCVLPALVGAALGR